MSEVQHGWFVLTKMRINLTAGNGVRLSNKDLASLYASAIGELMDAAHAYGTATGSVGLDPRLKPGAKLVLAERDPKP